MLAIIRLIERITEAAGGAAALVVIPLALATCYEVFVRYVFGAPTIWAFELGYTLMGIHFLLGGALTLKHRAHVRIDLIYAQLSEKARAIIDLSLFGLLVAPALWLLTQRLGEFAWGAFLSGEQTGQSAWNPPIWPFRFLITASFALLLLQVFAECLKCILTLRGQRWREDTVQGHAQAAEQSEP